MWTALTRRVQHPILAKFGASTWPTQRVVVVRVVMTRRTQAEKVSCRGNVFGRRVVVVVAVRPK